MLKTIANLEIKKENGVYTLLLPFNSNLGELHDVLHQMKDFVINKIIEIQKASAPVKENEPECKPVEEVVPVSE